MTRKKKAIITVTAILAAAAIVAGSAAAINSKKSDSTDAKVYVSAVSDNNTAVSNMYGGNCFSGVVETQKSLNVKYDSSKKINEVYVEEGSQVKKGDKLFSYDVDSMKLQKEQAQLEIDKNSADIESKNKQIEQLEKDKKKASSDEQFSFATQIQSLKTDISQAEYDIKVKKSEMSQIDKSIENSTVTAEMDGIVNKLNKISQNNGDDSQNTGDNTTDPDVIMTIIADGDFRVKGKVNEQNMSALYVDEPVIITSRVDSSVTWTGKISEISNEAEKNNNDMYYYGGGSDDYSTSSNYVFYVTLDSNENLMLGQHVIIEPDYGQADAIDKKGIWLMQDYVLTDDDGKTYVWAANKKNKLEKKYVEIGQKDDNSGDCEILKGLSEDDLIAYPDEYCKDGVTVTTNVEDITGDDSENMPADGGDVGNADGEGGADYAGGVDEGVSEEDFSDEVNSDDNAGDADNADNADDNAVGEVIFADSEDRV